VRRAAWTPALTAALGLTALACLALAVAWWVALVALLLLRLVAGPGLGLFAAQQGRLSVASGDDRWTYEQGGGRHTLILRHVWHGPAWTTLAFKTASSGKAFQLTVWRSRVSSAGWRRLRQLASRGPGGPRLRATEGQ